MNAALTVVLATIAIGFDDSNKSIDYKNKHHIWQSISFPDVKCVFGNGIAEPSMSMDDEAAADGLFFHLGFHWNDDDERKVGFCRPDGNEISVRIHYADGTVPPPIKTNFVGELPVIVHSENAFSGWFTCTFPWDKQSAQESWLELKLAESTYWLRIPRGFACNPDANPNTHPHLDRDRQWFPLDLEDAGNRKNVKDWSRVCYEYGVIQNGWRMQLCLTNSKQIVSEVVLHRDDLKPWNLNTPYVGIAYGQEKKLQRLGIRTSSQLTEGFMGRVDKFICENGIEEGGSVDWTSAIVTIDNQKWEKIVSSSLFLHDQIP